MTKTELKFRVVWDNDIPICQGIEVEETWTDINWKKVERIVYKLQKRIYRASLRGDTKVVRKLQKTLLNSRSAKVLATRQVTQDNQGKKTAGIDGVKSVRPEKRLTLAKSLKLTGKSKPTRRIWIPKPGTEEKRPLGIPTMNDRATQALVKMAMEPEWEAIFEPNSYGFRPGRSCHDAIEAIFSSIKQKPKYVLDADISKCFDKINHEALLRKINTYPKLRKQLSSWLKCGFIDQNVFNETIEGTPQGGVISPLLANIALHGMENEIKKYAETIENMYYPNGKRITMKKDRRSSLSLIRYADDFVILHENIEVVLKCFEIICEWLTEIGLELKPSKTRITHTLNDYEDEKAGFDFLGFAIRQFRVSKTHSKQGYKTIIKPSEKKIKIHYRHIAEAIESHKAAPQKALIAHLNPIIRGWSNYYSSAVSKEVFADIDSLVYQKLRAWSRRRHPNKSSKWISRKYWHTIGENNWVFSEEIGEDNIKLLKHADTKIVRHIQVKGDKSPYDGELMYWSTRMGKHPEMPIRVAKLLKKQNGKCTYCGQYFRESDLMEVDHITPKSIGGKNSYDNLQLLHRHCHDSKTALDRRMERERLQEIADSSARIWNKGINGESMTEEEERLFYQMTR